MNISRNKTCLLQFTFSLFIAIILFGGLLVIKTIFVIINLEPDERDFIKPVKGLQAFVTSSYFYNSSESLGDNSLALVLSLNTVNAWKPEKWWIPKNDQTLTIYAKNATNSVVVKADYVRLTTYEACKIKTIFTTVQLIPNVNSVSLIGNNGMVEIPFTSPRTERHKVVVCINPLYVFEQWQNFIMAAHVYKHFGAHLDVYMISTENAIFVLMKAYESQGFLNVTPWHSVRFAGLSTTVVFPYWEIEFRNQASAQIDCLLKYKESADFITFLDLNDLLIPQIAPSYHQEFSRILKNQKDVAYLYYEKENYDVTTVGSFSKFSISKTFQSFKYHSKHRTGNIVVNPKNLNYTWIGFPAFKPAGMRSIDVTDNRIRHLATISWEKKYTNLNTTQYFMMDEDIDAIGLEFKRIMRDRKIKNAYKQLQKKTYFQKIMKRCYYEQFEKLEEAGRLFKCPGPQLCPFLQYKGIKCTHVNANYKTMPEIEPISFYYATDPYFTTDIGCYPHE